MADFRRLLRTSTFQLTVLYASLFAVSISIFAGFLYWSTIGYLQRQTDEVIEAEVMGLAEQYRSSGLGRLVRVIRERIDAEPDSGALYLFADRNLNPLAGNLPGWPALASRADGWYSFQHWVDGEEVPARARVFALPEGLVLLVGREIGDLERITSRFRNALVWGGGLALLLALLVGVLMSTSVLHRVESINSTTRQIMSGDLSRRVESRGSGDEFDQLADNLNRMLEEIERLMEGIRHVADNIAHDLRTPLTRLRNALEEAERESDPEAARQRVQTAIADADQLLQTFRALLRIARLEAGGYDVEHRPVLLNELVEDALDLYQAVAEDKNIELISRCEGPATVDGDRDLLFQLLANLIDNAVKYTPAAGRVVVGLNVEGESVALSVADSGPGIPEAMRSRVLERFFRMDSSRNEPGNGLGLSLVSAVARQHRAELALTDNAPGLKVTLRMPAVEQEAQS